jgi:uncharacterized surface protein with fasciclin (FAS1) repeats
MFAVVPAQAQSDMSTGTSSTTMSTTSTSVTSTVAAGPSVDFNALVGAKYDYIDLMAARTAGYSEDEVATISKISMASGVPFRTILGEVQQGQTFAMLADRYNLRLEDVRDVTDEKASIANFIAAYDATGKNATPGQPALMHVNLPGQMMDVTKTAQSDIVRNLSDSGKFTVLLKAIRTAGLEDTLKGTGPYTIFAPTDAAFGKLPKDQLNSLLADKPRLISVLNYHILPSRVDAATARSMTSPTSSPTLQGSTLQVTTGSTGDLMINDARVIQPDIVCSNGIIHAIDTVLMPTGAMGDMTPTATSSTTTPMSTTTDTQSSTSTSTNSTSVTISPDTTNSAGTSATTPTPNQ